MHDQSDHKQKNQKKINSDTGLWTQNSQPFWPQLAEAIKILGIENKKELLAVANFLELCSMNAYLQFFLFMHKNLDTLNILQFAFQDTMYLKIITRR
jgi:hypothetical protein